MGGEYLFLVMLLALKKKRLQMRDEKETEKSLNAALEAGYRHIDTAWIYRNEAVIGRVLQEWLSAKKLKREDLFITTKLPLAAMHPERVELFMKKSLENLQLDYVDLYLIHCPIGMPYNDGNPTPSVDEKGNFILEGKTDHAAIWKVRIAKNCTILNYLFA